MTIQKVRAPTKINLLEVEIDSDRVNDQSMMSVTAVMMKTDVNVYKVHNCRA